MKVFLAGGSGAIGKQLVPMLVANGHGVVATGTSRRKLAAIQEAGAEGIVLDVLDRDAVIAAVLRAEPDVVIHEATALAELSSFRNMDKSFALTNRLRTEGTDNLLEAARAAGARRFIAQSFSGWPNEKKGSMIKTEEDPLDDDPPPKARQGMAALKHVERVVGEATDIEGLVLRYGGFYGPGTSLAKDGGAHTEAVRKRQFPIVGEGTGVWSFLHIEDAARATAIAVERGAPGIYNIVDDDPAPVGEWLPVLAEAVGAPPPRHVPVWLGRLLAGNLAVSMMTEMRGSSNAKAKRELGWQPRYASWRDGFRGSPTVTAESGAAAA
ncbi:MAG TPA: NAD(P)-dependent oxidoreductase [Thermoleophilaceae bacterium]|nr:NAD(P)-dependent oxidoreductase [Thermoleophilaceae bacterium]